MPQGGGGSGSKKTLFIVLGVVGVGILLLIFASVLALTFLGDDDGDDGDVASSTTEQDDDETTTTEGEDGTGTTDEDGSGGGSSPSLPDAEAPGDFDDVVFDALGATCEEGDLAACDLLWVNTPIGSDAEAYGATCGGRQSDETPNSCTTEYEWDLPPGLARPDDLGDDDELDGLAADCEEGDLEACDDLTFEADTDSGYERYGRTCGGRLPVEALDEIFNSCAITYEDAS